MISKSLVLLTASLTLVSVYAAPVYDSKSWFAPSKKPYGGASRGYNKEIHNLLTAPAPAHAKRGSAALNPYAARRAAVNQYAALAARDGEEGEDCEEDPPVEPTDPEDPECSEDPEDPPQDPQVPEDPECPEEPEEPPQDPQVPEDPGCEEDPEDPQDPQDPEDPDCEDDPETPPSTGTTPDPTPNTSCKKQYTIKEGDFCSKVASDNGIDIKDFYKWNPSLDSECMHLELGQAYCVGM